jgi:hypothetical protein
MSRLLFALAIVCLAPAGASADPFPSTGDDPLKSWHLRLDTDATWGIGSQMYLGAQAHLIAQVPAWHTGRGSGSFDISFRGAYGNEAQFLAPWVDPEKVTGVNHRIQMQVGIGHGFHLTSSRRVSLGLHVLLGWNHLRGDFTVTYAAEDVFGEAAVRRNNPLVSGELTLAVRFSPRIGANLAIGAPFPTMTSYIIGMVHTGLGLSFYLL